MCFTFHCVSASVWACAAAFFQWSVFRLTLWSDLELAVAVSVFRQIDIVLLLGVVLVHGVGILGRFSLYVALRGNEIEANRK